MCLYLYIYIYVHIYPCTYLHTHVFSERPTKIGEQVAQPEGLPSGETWVLRSVYHLFLAAGVTVAFCSPVPSVKPESLLSLAVHMALSKQAMGLIRIYDTADLYHFV